MKINVLTATAELSDQELLSRLEALASQERKTSAELVAHLAALEARPALCAAQGFSSLFAYCTGALRLSEDAACARIEAARACRRFPAALDLLASGELTLTSLRMIRRHLTPENHQAVLARASGRSRREIEALVAELAPRPDVPSTVRKLPARHTPALSVVARPELSDKASGAPAIAPDVALLATTPTAPAADFAPRNALASVGLSISEPSTASAPARIAADRPVVRETAPERYRVQFTIGPKTHDRLRRLQALLRREIPNGDPAVIFDRAIALLLDRVEKKKLVAAASPSSRRSIRSGTDSEIADARARLAAAVRTPIVASRRISNGVKRAVSQRDGGQCAYVAPNGRRCGEPAFVEFHHVVPYARRGQGTVANISLRCRRHNQYEAQLVFGPRRIATSRPPSPPSDPPSSP